MPEGGQYESDLARTRPLWWVLTLIMVVIVGSCGLIWLFFPASESVRIVATDQAPDRAPQLQVAPVQDYETFHRKAEQHLQGVGWVDREANLVHMPIERAMTLLLERGLRGEDQ